MGPRARMVTGTRNTAAIAGTASDVKYSALFRATRCEVGAVTPDPVPGQRRINRKYVAFRIARGEYNSGPDGVAVLRF